MAAGPLRRCGDHTSGRVARLSSKQLDDAESSKSHHRVVVHSERRVSKEIPHLLAVPEPLVSSSPFGNRHIFLTLVARASTERRPGERDGRLWKSSTSNSRRESRRLAGRAKGRGRRIQSGANRRTRSLLDSVGSTSGKRTPPEKGTLSGQPPKLRREVDFPDLGGFRRQSRQSQRR